MLFRTAHPLASGHDRSPEAILAELSISEPSEIDVDLIAQHCGATTVYERLRGCEARIVRLGARAYISVQSSSRRSRQRFSVAHELGHLMLDGALAAEPCRLASVRSSHAPDAAEARANRFAVALLMPRFMFAPRAARKPATFETIASLAQTFDTSLETTASRFAALGTSRVLFLRYKAGRSVWPKYHPSFPAQFRPPAAPQLGTLAYDLLRGAEPADDTLDVQADAWFTDPAARHYWVQESSIRTARDCVLTLLEWTCGRQQWAPLGASQTALT
jgi:hypothetical protein